MVSSALVGSKRLISYISVSLLLFFGGCASVPDPLPAGIQAPFARITYADGRLDVLDSYKGTEVVMLFWAKWCSRSKAAMRRFNTMALNSRALGKSTVFLAVNLDEYENTFEVRDYIEEKNLTAGRHVISGNGPTDETAHAFKTFVIPRFYVISPDGMIQISTDDSGDVEEYLGLEDMEASSERIQLGLIVPDTCMFQH